MPNHCLFLAVFSLCPYEIDLVKKDVHLNMFVLVRICDLNVELKFDAVVQIRIYSSDFPPQQYRITTAVYFSCAEQQNVVITNFVSRVADMQTLLYLLSLSYENSSFKSILRHLGISSAYMMDRINYV